MLVLVPLVFVLVAAGSIADAMELLRGRSRCGHPDRDRGVGGRLLSGLAMYSRYARPASLTNGCCWPGYRRCGFFAARAVTGLLMAGLVSAVALIALAFRTNVDHPARVILGTLMLALEHLAIGALVGVAVSNPVNGAVVILLIWMIDVFVGAAGSGGNYVFTRWGCPTHFVTSWMVDTPSHHRGTAR